MSSSEQSQIRTRVFTRVLGPYSSTGSVFDTFDLEGVGDMIQALAARTSSKILDVVGAADERAREHAIDILTTRFRLHGLTIDRMLGLPDSSITVLTRAQVSAMVAALPRDY